MTETQKLELKNILENKEYWTLQEIRILIKEKYLVEYSDQQVRNILRKYKMICSKPYPIDYREPEEAEEILRENLEKAFDEVKQKQIDPKEVAIGFLDESSPQNRANTVRVWSFKKVKIIKNSSRLKTNCAGFYTIKGNDVLKFLNKSKKEDICDLLKEIKEKNQEYKAIIIILDNYKAHKADIVQQTAKDLGIYLVYMPVYSPRLNPIEQIWRMIKKSMSTVFISSSEMAQNIIKNKFFLITNQLNTCRFWLSLFFAPIWNLFLNSSLLL